MTTPARLGAFALVLVLAFGAAFALGRGAGGGALATAAPGGHEEDAGHDGMPDAAPPPAGLAVAERGLRLVTVDAPEGTYAFRIAGDDGVVRDFDVEHETKMHLVVVRRDLTGFHHLHPVMDAEGTWRTPLAFDAPGAYRLFADFAVGGERRGRVLTAALTVEER